MALIDIGANLTHDSFDADREAILQRALNAGVDRMILTGSDLDSSRSAIALAQAQPDYLAATAGLHPHQAEQWTDELARLMADAASSGAIVALGEMGLDFYRDISPRYVQEKVFEAQLAIAGDHGMPVFLHQRDAHGRFFEILSRYLSSVPRAVVHCFTDSAEALADYIEADLYVGITGWICDERRGRNLYDIVSRIPDQRLMIETDCPYLLPRNIRPKPDTRRNEPSYLPWICQRVAEARNQSAAHVEQITRENAERFFSLEATATSG